MISRSSLAGVFLLFHCTFLVCLRWLMFSINPAYDIEKFTASFKENFQSQSLETFTQGKYVGGVNVLLRVCQVQLNWKCNVDNWEQRLLIVGLPVPARRLQKLGSSLAKTALKTSTSSSNQS